MNTATETSKVQQPAEEEVIERILAGETRVYEIIMRRYNARLYRVGMSIINSDADVEDVMQTTYIKAYENLRLFERRSSFATWLTKIMINESLRHLKRSKRYTTMEIKDESEGRTAPPAMGATTPAGLLLNKELAGILEQAVFQLPEKYRLVFVLREMENMSIAETVDTLNITKANVKVRLNRAKSMLRDSLGNYYKNDGIYHFHLDRCDRIVASVLKHLGIS
jgi:RNA polymerase sigma factor (sigma-70 family)